jgi:hypothetical protein
MIGWIALAGIIVRNSILLVDFTKHEVARGVHVTDAVINACQARTRPIVITALALVGGSSVILTDPIFEGMAISLLFGVLVSTVLTLFVIPLGCISAKKAFENCEVACADDDDINPDGTVAVVEEYKTPLWMKIYSFIVGIVSWVVVIIQMVFNLLRMLVGMLGFGRSKSSSTPPPPPPPAPPSTPAPTSPPAPSSGGVSSSTSGPSDDTGDDAPGEEKTSSTPKSVKSGDESGVKKEAQPAKKTVSPASDETPEKEQAEKEPVTSKPVKDDTKKQTSSPSAKKVPSKKTAVKKMPTKKIAAKNNETRETAPGKSPVKKAPSKKTSPGGRRGIRLKDV